MDKDRHEIVPSLPEGTHAEVAGGPAVVTVTVRREDLDDAVSALGYVHSDYCLSTDRCGCEARISRLEAAIEAATP